MTLFIQCAMLAKPQDCQSISTSSRSINMIRTPLEFERNNQTATHRKIFTTTIQYSYVSN